MGVSPERPGAVRAPRSGVAGTGSPGTVLSLPGNAASRKEEDAVKTCNSGEDRTIYCPRCRRPNPFELIYCAVLDCAAVLQPGPDRLRRLSRRHPGQRPFLPRLRPPNGIPQRIGAVHPQENPVR